MKILCCVFNHDADFIVFPINLMHMKAKMKEHSSFVVIINDEQYSK